MAAGTYTFYNQFKRFALDGTIDINTTALDLHLFMSASDYATVTQSTLSQLSGEVTGINGYSKSGKQLVETWSTGASASEMRLDATALIWTASGGNIANVRAAVLVARTGASGKDGANKLVAYATLSTAQFTVTTGNTLTHTPSANGIFELN